MAIISTTLPNDGETIDASDVNTPFNDILGQLNGGLDSDNVATGGLNYENFGTITGEIPASDMQDSGNLEKFRDEANIGFVASGLVWSATTGLDGAMTAGVAYLTNGLRVAPSAIASKTFTASRDTYVDVATNGSISYSEVTNGAAVPAITTDYLRLVKVVTSGAAVTSITLIGANSQVPYSNPYKFRAYRTSAHNFTTSWVKVPFDTESFDTNSNFASSTYTAPVGGFYQFNARCSTSQNSGTHRLVIALYKNGSEAARGSDVFAGYFNGSAVADLIQLAAGDTVEVHALADATLAADVTAPSTTNYFSGYLVSRI